MPADTDSTPQTDDAPPSEAPWYSQAYDPAKPGELVADWHTKAPPDEADMWKEYAESRNPLEALKSERQRRIDAQTALRNKSDKAAGLPVRPEGEAATPEAIAAYRAAKGLPADHKGYGIAKPADYPAEIWDDAEAEAFAQVFLDAELSPDQVKAITAAYQKQGLAVFQAHTQAMAESKAAEATARANYIQTQKETLAQTHGINVDRELKLVTKLTAASGLDPELLNPDNPEKWVGADVFKSMVSLVAMIPKSGDPTARALGNMGQNQHKDRAYWQNLKPGDEDLTILSNPSHPRHKEVAAQKQAAYEQDIALRQK
jgi:hypothetical protein